MQTIKQTIRPSEAGLALISLIIVMLILGVVAYAFVTIISTHRFGFTVTESSLKSLYIEEGAFQLAKKYIKDRGDPVDYPVVDDYADGVPTFSNEPMGDGTFTVWIRQTDIVAFRYSNIKTTANVPY